MKIIRSDEKTWGTRNGSDWSGMIGLLDKKEADILVAGLTATRERSEAVDFSVVLLEDVISLTVARTPVGEGQSADINLMVFLTIFTVQAWLAFLGVALVFGAFYAFVARCPHNTVNHSDNTLMHYC